MWIISRINAVNLSLVLIMVNGSAAMAAEHGGPARVWGDLSTTYRVRESDSGNARYTNWRNTGTLRASSYIWRPWFALINGSLSLAVEETDSTGQPTTEDEFTTGDVQFDLFPTSRFPFRTYYREDRNEFDSQTFSQDLTTTEYGAMQQYRSRDGTDNYYAEYENNEQERNSENQFVSESLLLRSENGFARQSIETEIDLDSVDNTATDEQADSYSITLDHNYGSSTNLTLDSLVSSARVENDLLDSHSEVDTAQVSSFMTWHPRESKDLRITGSLRASETTVTEDGLALLPDREFESESSSANLNQGLLYRYSDNLQFIQSINLNSVDTDGEVVDTTSQSVGVRYSSNRVDSRFGDYGWNAGSTYSSLSGDIEEEESLESQFSHSLLNNYSLDSGYQLRTNLTQSLIYDSESEREDEKSIDHSYSMTWSGGATGQQNLIRFFVSDSRELNRDNDYFQLANFQYTGTSRLTRYSQFSGNASVQYTNQSFEGDRSEQTTSNGQLEYRHNRLFQTPGLSFVSELLLSLRQSETERLVEDLDEDPEMSWKNSLLYRIGRLETRVDFDVVKVGSEYDYIFEFQLKRSFGDL